MRSKSGWCIKMLNELELSFWKAKAFSQFYSTICRFLRGHLFIDLSPLTTLREEIFCEISGQSINFNFYSAISDAAAEWCFILLLNFLRSENLICIFYGGFDPSIWNLTVNWLALSMNCTSIFLLFFEPKYLRLL